MTNYYLTKNNLAGIIVLYNPGNDTIENVKSYINFLSHLYIIDNSETPDLHLINSLKNIGGNISYTAFGNNLGIAKALNEGCNLARLGNYDWVLTMDQDSFFETGVFFDQAFNREYLNTAIIAASYNAIHFNPQKSDRSGFTRVDYVITSGNILNIDAWLVLGGFTEKLFIDEVDNDFCIRAKNKGFNVLMSNEIFLKHRLGDAYNVRHVLTGKSLTLTKHSPLRVYYIFRNNFYLFKKYTFSNLNFVIDRVKNLIVMLVKITLYFPDKAIYFKYIFKALKDFAIGRYGKYVN